MFRVFAKFNVLFSRPRVRGRLRLGVVTRTMAHTVAAPDRSRAR
jgi:hypothetical protein